MASTLAARVFSLAACGADRPVLLYVVPAALCYAIVLSIGGGLTGPVDHGLTFNSMLLYLLEGRFDVDPEAIGYEGYVRDGRTYAYFGIFPALFRLAFLPFPDFATTDFTRLSCLAAATAMAFFKLLSALTVWRSAGPSARGPESSALLMLLCAAILFGGPQIQFLRPTIYQEVLLWSGALTAAFVYVVVHGWLGTRRFTAWHLAWLGLIAGLCLFTRVTTALGLYIAVGLLLLRAAWQADWKRRVTLIGPAAILAIFVMMTGWINYQRWGDPFVFADLQRSILALSNYPDRITRVQQYGEFNLLRLPFGLMYYFFPVWVFRDNQGDLLWSAFQQRLLDAIELPPSSFLVSDPLILGLAVFGLYQLRRDSRLPHRGDLALALAGLLVPIFLLLTAISMTYRYRIEFYPFFELSALIGFRYLVASPSVHRRRLCAVATAAGIVGAHVFVFLYIGSPIGPASFVLRDVGVLEYYRALLY